MGQLTKKKGEKHVAREKVFSLKASHLQQLDSIQASASVGAAYREKRKEKNTWLAKECKNKKNTNINKELNISSSDKRKNF